MLSQLMILSVATLSYASPLKSSDVRPALSSATLLGDAVDRNLQRDSCGSVKWGSRALWTCRDTEFLVNQSIPALVYNNSLLAFASSTASYTDFNSDGSPSIIPVTNDQYGYDHELVMYGDNHLESFYPLTDDECNSNPAGNCNDGTRFALWPSVPPTVTSEESDGSITAYTFIRVEHITDQLGVVNPDPPTSLYKLYSRGSGTDDILPAVTLINENFWGLDEFAYGDYGVMSHDDTLYLYAETSQYKIALAKVPLDQVEDHSAYQFYVDGLWTSDKPANVNVTGAYLDQPGAGGQGTYFYSQYFDTFIWLGQPAASVSPELYVSTAPAPEGPWIQPYLLHTFPGGNYSLSAYSFQAHPDLVADPTSNEMYLTYTKNNALGNNFAVYETPLYKLQFA